MLPTPFHDFIDFVQCLDQQMSYQRDQERLKKNIQSVQQQIKAEDSVLEQAQEKVRHAEKQLHTAELELASVQKKNREYQDKMERVSNPREYASLQAEQETNNSKKVQLEEQIIQLWDVIAQAQAAVLVAKESGRDKLARYKREEDQLKQALELADQHINEHNRLCLVKREQVRKEWLEKFDALKAHIPNPVVELRNSACVGCNNKVPAQIEARVSRRELCSCPLCGRLLYSLAAL